MTAPFHAEWTDTDALRGEVADWARLARESLEPNPFYGPDFLLATTDHLRNRRSITCLVVRDSEGRLAGLFPLERPHLRDGLIPGVWSLYRNRYSCLSTPLISRDMPELVLATAFKAMQASRRKRIIFPVLPENRACLSYLKAFAETNKLALIRIDGRSRAALETTFSADIYRATRWNKDTRSKHRRRMTKLSALGTVERLMVLGTAGDARMALDAYFRLEEAGWKGKRGTALASRRNTRAFAEALVAARTGDPGLWFDMLTLDGKAVAVTLNLYSQGAGYALKNAYDENYAPLAVASLLDGETVGLVAPGGFLTRIDSCASVEHPISRIWREEEPVGRYMLCLKPDDHPKWLTTQLAKIGQYGVWRGFRGPRKPSA